MLHTVPGGLWFPLALSVTSAATTPSVLAERSELHQQAVAALNNGAVAGGLAALSALESSDAEFFAENHYAYLRGVLAAKAGDDRVAASAFAALIARREVLADRAALRLASLPSIDFGRGLEAVRGFAKRFPTSAVMREARSREVVLLDRRGASTAADRVLLLLPRAWRRGVESELLSAAIKQGNGNRVRAIALRVLRASTSDRAAYAAATALVSGGTRDLAVFDRLSLGEALFKHRRFSEASTVLRPLVDAALPQQAEARFLSGRVATKAGDEAAARDAYELLVAAGGTLGERAAYQLARIELGCGDEVEAMARFGAIAVDASAQRPVAAEALLKLVRIHAGRRRLDEATRELAELDRQVGPSSSWSVQAALVVAAARLASGDPAAALQVLAGPRDRRERKPDVAYWRGRAFAALGRYVEAVDVLESAASGSDLVAALARAELARIAPVPTGVAADRLTEASAALAAGDGQRARRAAAAARAAGAAYQAGELLCAIDRKLPQHGHDFQATIAAPPAMAERPPAGGHEAAADTLLYLGFPGEAADELEKIPGAGRDANRLFEIAVLERRSGDFASSLRHAERLRTRLGLGYRAECLAADVFALLYPLAFAPLVEEAVARHGGDSALVRAVMREESRYDPSAHSAAGARGLMQFIPETASLVGSELGLELAFVEDIHAPELAIPIGARYLATLLRLFGGSVAPTVASYNAGEDLAWEWAQRAGSGDPAAFLVQIEFTETRAYVDRVLTSLAAYHSR